MAGAEQAAVDWGQEVAVLQGSSEWQDLLSDLAAAPGGAIVAPLLRRAAMAAAGAAAANDRTRSGGTTAGLCRLAEAVQQVAWEKLHSGDWHSVAVVWRDAYAAACILAAAAGLPGDGDAPGSSQQGAREAAGVQCTSAAAAAEGSAVQGAAQGAAAAEGQTEQGAALGASAAAEAAALAAGLWHLDMAAIMGGPLLRPLVDSLIWQMQRRWQQLHGTATWRPAVGQGAAAPAGAQQRPMEDSGEGSAEAPAKRQRRAGQGGSPGAADAAAAADRAADAAFLPPGSLGPRGTPVAAAELPSLEAFWRHYMSTDTPVVVNGAMEDWPAMSRWCEPAYLTAVAGPRTVPVEVGEHYLADGWGQQLMTLQQFVERHIAPDSSDGGSPPGRQQGEGQDQQQQQAGTAQQQQAQDDEQAAQLPQQGRQWQQGAQQSSGPVAGRGYLAQHPLFDQIPALAADIREPPYCVLGEGEVQSINAWFGPAGTVTPLHTDPHPNLLCQVAGRKYVRLYSPAQTSAMYPHAEGMHTNTGQVDVDAPDHERHPLFASAPFQDCVLEPGQMLFIPPGWWHYVKATTVSFSVSFWWR